MSIGEHDTCPYCGHSNLIISKNDAAVKSLVEAAKAMIRATMTCGDTDDADVYASRREVEKAIKKVEGL